MTPNKLRYGLAVVRERHFGRAAEACLVSEPTLSAAMHKPGGELGISLLALGWCRSFPHTRAVEVAAEAARAAALRCLA